MCRSIKTLRRPEGEAEATEDEIEAAARQFVRKLSGYNKPSQRNETAFEEAIDEIAASAKRMLDSLVVTAKRA